jgi:hypothetical protein
MATPRRPIALAPRHRHAGALEERHAKLILVANVSLDSYIEDAHGNFEWTREPGDEFRMGVESQEP